MRQVIRERRFTILDVNGDVYASVRVCAEAPPGTRVWHVWLEFVPQTGGPAIRTARQTTQPTLDAVAAWAAVLQPSDLEEAFHRALRLAPPVTGRVSALRNP